MNPAVLRRALIGLDDEQDLRAVEEGSELGWDGSFIGDTVKYGQAVLSENAEAIFSVDMKKARLALLFEAILPVAEKGEVVVVQPL